MNAVFPMAIAEARAAIRPYPDDWSGQGSRPVSEATAALAYRVFSRAYDSLGAPSHVGPTPGGSIAISWQEHGHYMEVEIDCDCEIEWMDTRHWSEAATDYPVA